MNNIRVLVLFGSPHENGPTAKLLNDFKQSLSAKIPNIIFSEIAPYQAPIKPCIACGYCKKIEGCVFHDLDVFDEVFRKVDLIIVASPVYELSFPAPLKAVFDRTQRYYEARFALGISPSIKKPKQAVLLSAYGSDNSYGVMVMNKQLALVFSVMNTTLRHTITVPHTDKNEWDLIDLKEKIGNVVLDISNHL